MPQKKKQKKKKKKMNRKAAHVLLNLLSWRFGCRKGKNRGGSDGNVKTLTRLSTGTFCNFLPLLHVLTGVTKYKYVLVCIWNETWIWSEKVKVVVFILTIVDETAEKIIPAGLENTAIPQVKTKITGIPPTLYASFCYLLSGWYPNFLPFKEEQLLWNPLRPLLFDLIYSVFTVVQ